MVDWMRPRPMTAPLVLYRSVSLLELVDIFSRGAIIGGGNRFNIADGRSCVLFADGLSDALIRQGENVDRQAEFALRDHSLVSQLDWIALEDERVRDRILGELDTPGVDLEPDLRDDFRVGMGHGLIFREACRAMGSTRPKVAALFRNLRDLHRQCLIYREAYVRLHASKCTEIEERLARLPYSSAVVVTRPIAGGLLYSNEFGSSGLGEREYGFRPGRVTVRDISHVIFVKAGRQVDKFPVEESEEPLDGPNIRSIGRAHTRRAHHA